MMKCKARLEWKCFLLLAWLILLATVMHTKWDSKVIPSGRLPIATNNPQDFFLWGNNSSVSYSFRYDPRAADEWLFHSGAWLFGTAPSATVTRLAH